jgi:hypothetical protein
MVVRLKGLWANSHPKDKVERSQLKYTNCRFCVSLERKVCPLEESLGFHIAQTLGFKTPKKCRHVGILEAIVYWLLDSSIKAEQTNYYSPPIKLLDSFVCSTNGHSVKCP